jgi:uncharacterized protein YycO
MRAILQLHNGTSLISRLITWQTRSTVSHASIWFPDDDVVIESKEGRGVQQTPGASHAADRAAGRIQCFAVQGMTPELAKAVREFMSAKVGAGYDYRAILKFISRRRAGHNTRWFCSELVFAAYQHAGIRLLAHIEAWAVSPGDLLTSPLLVPLDESALEEAVRTPSPPPDAAPLFI